MTIAEIKGKISSTGSNLHDQLEDLLTSDVFSACRYQQPESLLIPLLATARNLPGNSLEEYIPRSGLEAEYFFWPRLKHSEPDVLIVIQGSDGRTIVVMVEAKYLSGKSGDTLENDELEVAAAPTDQLAREFQDLQSIEDYLHLSTDRIQHRFLVYVTAHRSIPIEELVESRREIEKFHPSVRIGLLYWTSWFNFVVAIRENLMDTIDQDPVIEDLLTLLERKRFVQFKGYGRLDPMSSSLATAIYQSAGSHAALTHHFKLVPLESRPVGFYGAGDVGSLEYAWQLLNPEPVAGLYS